MWRWLLLLVAFMGPIRAEAPYAFTLFPANNTFRQWEFERKTRDGFEAVVDVRLQKAFTGHLEFGACSLTRPGVEYHFSAWPISDLLGKLHDIPDGRQGSIRFEIPDMTGMEHYRDDDLYLFAILVDGKRCSNVVRVRIQHDYDAAREPALRVFAVPPVRGDAIQQVGVWIVPPHEDKNLTTFSASAIDLTIDGVPHRAYHSLFDGLEEPLPAAKSYVTFCSFRQTTPPYKSSAYYQPPIHPFQHAKVQGHLLQFSSAVTNISLDAQYFADTEQFDKELGVTAAR